MNRDPDRDAGGLEPPDDFDDKAQYLDWFRAVGSRLVTRLALARPRAGFGEPQAFSGQRATVVMAIIDDAIAFAHVRFRRQWDRTRVEAIWLQDALDLRDGRVPYGRELGQQEINGLLRRYTEAGIVDEDALYRDPLVGLGPLGERPVSASLYGRTAHGTLNLDLLAGFPIGDPVGAERPILAVQLPRRVTQDSSGTLTPGYTRAAFEWIIDRAKGLARGRPVVINFSYGTYAGPHDGSSDLERTLARLAPASSGLHLVMPAGNSYMSQTHAWLPAAAPEGVRWQLQPDDSTPSFVEIWPRSVRPAPITVALDPPAGWTVEARRTTARFTGYELAGFGGRLSAGVYHPPADAPGPVVVAAAPTAALLDEPLTEPCRAEDIGFPPACAERVGLAPAGEWTIRVLCDVAVDLWVQRDDVVVGPSGGRQSYFVEGDDAYAYEGHGRPRPSAGPVVRTDTLNAMATGTDTVTVAGFRRSDGRMAIYSSSGSIEPDAPPNRLPDLAAPSDEGVAHVGMLGAGPRSGAVVAMSGTSVAAPQVGRRIADNLSARTPRAPLSSADVENGAGGLHSVLDGSRAEQRARRGAGRLTDPAARSPLRREAEIDFDSAGEAGTRQTDQGMLSTFSG